MIAVFAGPNLTLSAADPAVKNISVWGVSITYYEGAVGTIFQLAIVSAIVAYVYFCLIPLVRQYRKTRYRPLLLIITSLVLYFGGVLNDSMVAMQFYDFIYISEYMFFFIIIAMAYTLLDKFVILHRSYEELNLELEQKVHARTREVETLNKHLKNLAERDGLTGIYNRRFFDGYFEIEVRRAKSYLEHQSRFGEQNSMNFGLAIMDIDGFKGINDNYGHPVGDFVLKQVVEIMTQNIFSRDVLCRYGGDEFALLLTKTTGSGIIQATEKIRKEIAEHDFIYNQDSAALHVTVSVGLVTFDEVIDKESQEILKITDDRLLKAKNSGKDRVIYSVKI